MLFITALPTEYRLRESFEQSSSDSGATSAAPGSELASGAPRLAAPAVPILAPRPFSLLRAFVPSFALAWLALALLALLLFETEWAPLRALRRKPELLALRTYYYAPLKDYFKRKLLELFWFRLRRKASSEQWRLGPLRLMLTRFLPLC